MLNTDFIQSNLPDLHTQEQLLKDRFEEEKANGYNFELIPIKKELDTIKLANKYELEDREYSLEELNNLSFILLEGLVDGIIRRADIMKAKNATISYSIESMVIPWGMDIRDSKGFVLFYPLINVLTIIQRKKKQKLLIYLLGITLVTFN